MTIKVGDSVKCLDARGGAPLVPGKIYKVVGVNSHGFLYLEGIPGIGYDYTRFEVVSPMVGRKVRCTNNDSAENELQVGSIYQIEEVAYNGNCRLKEVNNQWYMPSRFQLVDDEATISTAPEVTVLTTPTVSEKPFDFDTYNSVLPGRR